MAGAGGIKGPNVQKLETVSPVTIGEAGEVSKTRKTGTARGPVGSSDGYSAAKGSGRKRKTETRYEALRSGGGVQRGDRPLPSGARVLQPKKGEPLEEALLRDGMYGGEISAAVLAQVARMNGITDVRNPGSKLITVFRPEDIYREVRPHDKRRMLEKARFIAVGPHQSWDDVVNGLLTGIPNDEARRGVIRAFRLVNGLRDNAPPPPILVAPDWEDMAGAVATLQQQDGRPVGTRQLDQLVKDDVRRHKVDPDDVEQTHTAGAMYAPKPGEDLRYMMLATYHRHLLAKGLTDDQAARLLEEYMLVVARLNGLDTTEVDQYGSIYLPDTKRLDREALRMRDLRVFKRARQQPGSVASDVFGTGLGALRDARAHADGTAPPPTLRTASKEDLQSAMNVLFANGFHQEQAENNERYGWIPYAGYMLAFGNTLLKMSEARQRVSNERSNDESYAAWLDRTGTSLSPGKQKRRKRAGERVAKDVARLQELGLVDGKGYLTFNIEDPQQVESEVRAVLRARGIDIDATVRDRLVAGLKNQLAGMTKGKEPITEIDGYNAMLVAGMGVPRDPTKPVSIVFSETDERMLEEALLAQEFEYDPEAAEEAYSAGVNPADVRIVASRLRAAVAKLDPTLEEEYRDRLQQALMRHARAIAYLERETKDYDERIKLAAQVIERELSAGRRVNGPPTRGLTASLDPGS